MTKKTESAAKYAAIPNQVFLGIPAKTIRAKYEAAVEQLKKRYPLYFVIVGRSDEQDAEDLLEIIKKRVLTSSYAIFDATGGNANVSLEYGFADANEIPKALYLSSHKASKRPTKESPIIADLAGKWQNRYSQVPALLKLLSQFCAKHPYTKRFEVFLTSNFQRRSSGEKKRLRALCLKIIHHLSGEGKARRADVVQNLQADISAYKKDEIDVMITRMHGEGLVESVQGPYSIVSVV